MTRHENLAEMPQGAPKSEEWEHQVALQPLTLLGDADAGACADGVCSF